MLPGQIHHNISTYTDSALINNKYPFLHLHVACAGKWGRGCITEDLHSQCSLSESVDELELVTWVPVLGDPGISGTLGGLGSQKLVCDGGGLNDVSLSLSYERGFVRGAGLLSWATQH